MLDLQNWEWRDEGVAQTSHGFMSSVIVKNDASQEKLICVGGSDRDNGSTRCDLYDIENKEWTKIANMNFPRHRTGIYDDKWQQRIYVGGGNGAERKIEYYDLNKNKWYFDPENIPFTSMKHNIYPIIWQQDGHSLYIASVKANGVEMVDLRQQNRKWNVVYDSLDPLFDTNIVWYNAPNCRLIQ